MTSSEFHLKCATISIESERQTLVTVYTSNNPNYHQRPRLGHARSRSRGSRSRGRRGRHRRRRCLRRHLRRRLPIMDLGHNLPLRRCEG